jgi:glycosyltransferase involved in cell wall biosynthesis
LINREQIQQLRVRFGENGGAMIGRIQDILSALPNPRAHTSASLKVTLMTDSAEPSGVGEHMLTLAEGLKRHVEVDLVFPADGGGRPFTERAFTSGLQSLRPTWEELRSGAGYVEDWLRHCKPDIVHVHAGITWEGKGLMQAARRAGVPVLVRTEHLPCRIWDPENLELYGRMLGSLDRVICVSETARAAFLQYGFPAETFSVVVNGIRPIAAVRPRAAVRKSLGLGPSDRMAITVARLTEQKRHERLLAAIPEVLAVNPQVRFVWAGAGEREEEMRERIAAAGLESSVMLLGARSDVCDLLAAADVFMLASDFEGLPLSVLEAMAMGLPVVGTRVPGIEEAVEHEVTGLLCDPEDPFALAKAVLQLANPIAAQLFGARGRTRCASVFCADRMAQDTLAIYREVLGADAEGEDQARIAS